jgi:predicted alpha/beta-hydrolase family hydrolase
MTDNRWTVSVGSDTTSAAFDPPESGDTGIVFVCAHGAGGNMNDRAMVQVSAAMGSQGIGVVRFNFLYKERKSGRPDPMPRLQSTFSAVVDRVKQELSPKKLVIGGRSMGGRVASMMAAEHFECDGLLLLAYPLHPPGHPEKIRDAHLPSIEVPVLCFCGTRDPFCTPALMEKAIKTVNTDWEMHWIEGADHSFHVLKSSGRTDADVIRDVAQTAAQWGQTRLKPKD